MVDQNYKVACRTSQPTRARSVFFDLFLLAKEKERLESEKTTWQTRIGQINARLKVINSKLAALEPQVRNQLGVLDEPENEGENSSISIRNANCQSNLETSGGGEGK